MLYYFKKGFFPFLYLLFMFVIALGIMAINGLEFLKYILAALNLALYFFVVGVVAFKDGQDAIKVRMRNDLERREIVRTGEDRPLKLHEEYKSYKGVLIALTTCAPMLVLLAVQAILNLSGVENTTCGQITTYIYFVTFVFFRIAGLEINCWGVFLSLSYLALIVPVYSILYNLGARKIELQHEKIRMGKEFAYGVKNENSRRKV